MPGEGDVAEGDCAIWEADRRVSEDSECLAKNGLEAFYGGPVDEYG